MLARREKGLCYNCDEKYTPGHKCKHRAYILMNNDKEYMFHLPSSQNLLDQIEENEELEEAQLSLNAMSGRVGKGTMRFTGNYQGNPLQIIIDTGSTLSFH